MTCAERKFGILLTTLALVAGLTVASSFAATKSQSFTGKVSDAMCGSKHMMQGDDAACLRACVAKGSKYALIVGDKVYTLDTNDSALLGQLDKLAAQEATVTGKADGDTIAVSSVTAAK